MSALPTLKQLQYLVALSAQLNFTRAAEACFVTQSTLSAGLKELETVLGTPLVERDPTPEERRMIVAGLRRHAAALRTSATAKRRPFHARRAASQDERQAQIDEMESDT